MKKSTIILGIAISVAIVVTSCVESTEIVEVENTITTDVVVQLKGQPYADNNGAIPTKEEYADTLLNMRENIIIQK